MARIAKAAGQQLIVVGNHDLYSVRDGTLKQIWSGWTRIFCGSFVGGTALGRRSCWPLFIRSVDIAFRGDFDGRPDRRARRCGDAEVSGDGGA
ncbi:MAG: hypothetical protein IPK83_01755 [Planctomycetes bacterium]|nr:hypothetical protein [Planctomycetota bacterium]